MGSTEAEFTSTHRALDDLEVHARGLVFQIDMLIRAIHRNLHHVSPTHLFIPRYLLQMVGFLPKLAPLYHLFPFVDEISYRIYYILD